MFTKLLLGVASSTIALSTFAMDNSDCNHATQTKDGSTLHVFPDGKMAMEDRFGHTVNMQPGTAMQTKDGKTIIMNGNETMRLYPLITRESNG